VTALLTMLLAVRHDQDWSGFAVIMLGLLALVAWSLVDQHRKVRATMRRSNLVEPTVIHLTRRPGDLLVVGCGCDDADCDGSCDLGEQRRVDESADRAVDQVRGR
jgi:hypothetical protein